MTRPLHLLALWNPAYSGDALDVHLSLLLEWSRRRGGRAAGDAERDKTSAFACESRGSCVAT